MKKSVKRLLATTSLATIIATFNLLPAYAKAATNVKTATNVQVTTQDSNCKILVDNSNIRQVSSIDGNNKIICTYHKSTGIVDVQTTDITTNKSSTQSIDTLSAVSASKNNKKILNNTIKPMDTGVVASNSSLFYWDDYWTFYSTGLYDICVSGDTVSETTLNSYYSNVKSDINTESNYQAAAIGTAAATICGTIAAAISNYDNPTKALAQSIGVACGGTITTGTLIYEAYTYHEDALSNFYY